MCPFPCSDLKSGWTEFSSRFASWKSLSLPEVGDDPERMNQASMSRSVRDAAVVLLCAFATVRGLLDLRFGLGTPVYVLDVG